MSELKDITKSQGFEGNFWKTRSRVRLIKKYYPHIPIVIPKDTKIILLKYLVSKNIFSSEEYVEIYYNDMVLMKCFTGLNGDEVAHLFDLQPE